MLFALGAVCALATTPLLAAPQVTLRAYLLDSADANLAQVQAAVEVASGILSSGCAIHLSLAANTELTLGHGLPEERTARKQALRKLASPFKAEHPRDLALFILPSDNRARYSYAWIDSSPGAGCDSPREKGWLSRFGVLFLTDFGLRSAQALDAARGDAPSSKPAFAGILLAHEVLHALTQRPHPTLLAPGHLMADGLSEMGAKIDPDWCACALQSPYLRP